MQYVVLQETGLDTVDANRALGLPDDCREYTSVTNILADLDVKSIKLMVRFASAPGFILPALFHNVTHAVLPRGIVHAQTKRLVSGCHQCTLSVSGLHCPHRSYIASLFILQTNNPRKIELLRATGVKVTDRIPCIVEGQAFSQNYLDIKQSKMAHDFDGSYCYWNHDGTALLPNTQIPAIDTVTAERTPPNKD